MTNLCDKLRMTRREVNIVVACAVAMSASAAYASPDPAKVLVNVEHYYATANQLTAQFTQVVTNSTFGTKQSNAGTLWVEKPDRFRFDYSRSGKVTKAFVFDSATLWIVDVANLQIYQQDAKKSARPAAVSFLTNASALTTSFDVKVIDTASSAKSIVLALTPKQPSVQYKELRFTVDVGDGHVTASSVISPSGDTSELSFSNENTQTPIAMSLFQVNPAKLPTYKLIQP